MRIIRKYKDYQKYLAHQKEKSLNTARVDKWLNEEWQPKVDMFTEHFKRNKEYIKGKALGICARTGQEIEALNKLGVDAIGVDIVPYPPLVIMGDAHSLPFKQETFDFVFSNSFDHSIYPELFLSEMVRVLKHGRYGMLHLQVTDEVDAYAENIVLDTKSVIDLLKAKIIKDIEINDICYNREIIFKK